MREPVSKRMRFEVFKRDSFKCQYCGRSAPDVILVIDHIEPCKSGGKSRLLNLITACEGCNSGKAAIPLSDTSAVEGKATIKKLIRRYGLDEVLKCVEIAAEKCPSDPFEFFSKIPKVCAWRRLEQTNPTESKLRWIAGIIRNRTGYDGWKMMADLKEYHKRGVSLRDLESAALSANTTYEFEKLAEANL